jgi:hypothetical protein
VGGQCLVVNLGGQEQDGVSGTKETGHGGSVVCVPFPGIVEGSTSHWATL